jgi:hypothetical protein
MCHISLLSGVWQVKKHQLNTNRPMHRNDRHSYWWSYHRNFWPKSDAVHAQYVWDGLHPMQMGCTVTVQLLNWKSPTSLFCYSVCQILLSRWPNSKIHLQQTLTRDDFFQTAWDELSCMDTYVKVCRISDCHRWAWWENITRICGLLIEDCSPRPVVERFGCLVPQTSCLTLRTEKGLWNADQTGIH